MSSIFILDAFSMKIISNFADTFVQFAETFCNLNSCKIGFLFMSVSLGYLDCYWCLVNFAFTTVKVSHTWLLGMICSTIFKGPNSTQITAQNSVNDSQWRQARRHLFYPVFAVYVIETYSSQLLFVLSNQFDQGQACCAWHWPWAFTLRHGTLNLRLEPGAQNLWAYVVFLYRVLWCLDRA